MITIGGALTTIGLIIYIIKNRNNEKLGINLFIITILASLVFDIGYFARIKNTIIEYNYVFSIISFLGLIITYIKKRELNKKDISIIVAFIIYIGFNMLCPIIFNRSYISVSFRDAWDLYFADKKDLGVVYFSRHSLGMYARVIMFIVAFYIFAKNVDKQDMIKYAEVSYKISWGIIVFAVLEFFITNIIDTSIFRKMVFFILGKTDATYIVPRMGFGGIYMPMGFMREPASYVKTLFIFILNNIFILYNCKNQEQKEFVIFNIVLLMITIFVSTSLSGYIYITAVMLIYLYMLKNKKIKTVVSIIIPILIMLLILVAKNRLMIFMESFKYLNIPPKELNLHSELIRLYSINNNLNLFLQYPILGCGFGTVYCYSAIITLAANIGAVGIGFYIYMIYYINSIATDSKKFSYLTLVILFITNCLTGHMSQIIYLETFAFQVVMLKLIDSLKRRKLNE